MSYNPIFKDWLIQKGKQKETAAVYSSTVYKWSERLPKELKPGFDNLPSIFSGDEVLGNDVSTALIAAVHEKKYACQKGSKSAQSKKKRVIAAKAGNTADNIVTFVNQYIKYSKEISKNISEVIEENSTLRKYIKDRKEKLTKNSQRLKIKMLSSLTTQDRAYKDIERWDGKKYITFPICLISKILHDKNGFKDWKKEVYESIKVFIGPDKEKDYCMISTIESMRIEPYKRVIIVKTGSQKEYSLRTREDEKSKLHILKVAEFADISIGHMPPISEVFVDLEKCQNTSLPAIEELSDVIHKYFDKYNIEFNSINVGNATNMKNVLDSCPGLRCEDFQSKLLKDLNTIHKSEKYELQGRSENSSMGGINRKSVNKVST